MKGDNLEEIRLCLVGCGAAANRYYVPALKRHPQICRNLVLVDSNLDRARALAACFGKVEIHQDYHEVIGRVEGAILAVPHLLHYDLTMDFLQAGVPVLCEKPLAETASDAVAMV